jgi:hypothetical protein
MSKNGLTITLKLKGIKEINMVKDFLSKKEYTINVAHNMDEVAGDVKKIEQNTSRVNNQLDLTNKNTGTWKGELANIGFAIQGLLNSLKLVNKVLSETVGLATQHLRAERLVANTIKTIGDAAGYSTSELKKMASELQKITNYGDDDILSNVSNTLLTFGNIQGKVFAEAQRSVLDMATVLGSDLQSASLQLGKALQDPIEGINSLSRVGVRFTAEQKETIDVMMALGDVAGAQGIILQEVTKRFGGQAQNLADPFRQLKNAFDDLKESLGLAIIPLMHDIVIVLKHISNGLKWLVELLQKIPGFFSALATVVSLLTIRMVLLKFVNIDVVKGYIAKIGVMKADTIATIASSKATSASIKALLAQKLGLTGVTTAVKGLTIAKGALKVAQLMLNKALSANPIYLIIAGIVLLVYWIGKLLVMFVRWVTGAKKKNAEIAKLSAESATQEVENIRESMKTQEQIINESFRRQKEALQRHVAEGKMTLQEMAEQVRHISKLREDALLQIQREGIEASISLMEKKVAVGKATNAELLTDITEYVTLMRRIYGEEHEIYLDALKRKQDLIKEMGQAQENLRSQLDAFRLSIKSQAQSIKHAYDTQLAEQKKFLDAGLIAYAEYQKNLTYIRSQRDRGLNDLETSTLIENIALVEKRVQLGLATNDHLRTHLESYLAFTTTTYGVESRQYLDALKRQQDFIKEMAKPTQELQKSLDKYNQSLKSESQILREHYAELLEMQDSFRKSGLISEEVYSENYMRLQRELSDAQRDIRREELERDIDLMQRKVDVGLATKDELFALHRDYFDFVEQMYEKDSEAYIGMLEMRLGVTKTSWEQTIEYIKEQTHIYGDMVVGMIHTITDSMAKGFSAMILKGRSFSEMIRGLWKDLATFVVNEISRMIAKWLVLQTLKAFAPVPFKDGGAVTTFSHRPQAYASGGYISGAGSGTSDSIPALLSNGEYVINAYKTSIFKPLLDMINYGSLSNISALLPSVPRWSVPAFPRYAYASGGLVSGGFDMRGIEHRLDQVVDRLDALERKDYYVNVKTSFDGVTFAKEIDRAKAEQARRI